MNLKKRLKKLGNSYFFVYTIICAAAMLIVFNQFIVYKTSFVWFPDSTSQHFTCFVYYGKYLREIARNLLAGQLVLPQYNFSIGFGDDILTTLHYYVIGDPLNLVSAVIPSKYAVYGYTILMLFRYYLAGLAFMALAKYKKLPALSSTCGALIYIFNTYSLYMAIRHPSFLNPFIYFPLVILGIEMIFDKKRPYLFILSICLSALSSFYYFYVISLFTVLYIFVRLFFRYRQQFFKNFFISLGKFGGCYIVGVLMAAIVFVPVVVSFLSANRSSVDYGLTLFFPKIFYQGILAAFTGKIIVGNNIYLGFSALGIAGAVLLFCRKKQNGFLKTSFIILSIMVLFPIFGKIINGFSYVANRWVFVYALLVAFIFADAIKDIKQITLKQSLILCAASAVFAIYVFAFDITRIENIILSAVILFMFSAICLAYNVYPYIKQNFDKGKAVSLVNTAVLLLTAFAVYTTSVYTFDPSETSFMPEFRSNQTASDFVYNNGYKRMQKYQNTENAVERYEEKGELGEMNNSLLSDTYSNQEYYSLSNSNVNNFQNEMGLVFRNYSIVNATECDPFIYAAENIKYYLGENMNETYYGINQEPIDYLRSNLKENKNTKKGLYENENYIPFGYTYKNVISAEDYNALSSTEKRAALVNAVVLNDTDAYVNSSSADFDINDVKNPFTMEPSGDIKIDGNKIFVYRDKLTVTLKTDIKQAGQLYCRFHNIKFTSVNSSELLRNIEPERLENLTPKLAQEQKFRDDHWGELKSAWLIVNGNDRETSFNLTTPFNDYYSGIKDYTVNLGYCDIGEAEIKLTFYAGIYDFDSIEIVTKDMSDFEKDIDALSEDTLEDLKIETDKISGRISLDESKILYLSIPYSEYWTAVVDGKEAEIFKANTAFSAIALDAGEHTVELKYRNTSIDKSAFISAGGFVIFAGVVAAYEIYNKKRKNKI